MSIIKETCVETKREIDLAIANHTNQLELCSRLDLAGLTPEDDVVNYALKQTKHLIIMIRRRDDHFNTKESEEQLVADINKWNKTDVQGFVFGFLNKDKTIDQELTKKFVTLARGRETVFHMAFDETPDQFQAIDTLVSLGVTRILTKGGPKGPATNNLEKLAKLFSYAKGRIQIICGGSVTDDNYQAIAQATNINMFHGRKLGIK